MFKALKKTLRQCEIALRRKDYSKVFYELGQERVEEHYLKEGYDREFQIINKILANFLVYLSQVGNNTAIADSYKLKGKEFRKQEKEQREKAVKEIGFLRDILDQLENEIKRLMKASKRD